MLYCTEVKSQRGADLPVPPRIIAEEERGLESVLDDSGAITILLSNSHEYLDRNYSGVQAEG